MGEGAGRPRGEVTEVNSVTFARSSRTDPDDGDSGWNPEPPSPSSGEADAGAADASDVSGAGDAPDGGGGASGAAANPCGDFGPNHDFDACVNDLITNGVLSSRQPGETDAIDARDITQGALGDCSLLASLGALSQTPDGRALLRNAI